MKSTFGMALTVGALALTWALAGCGGGTDQTATAPSPSTGTPAAPTTTATAGSLGAEQTAGPFQVALTTEPAAPKVGDTRFRAQVTRDGQPVKDATVTVSLSMPSMNMGGPETTLTAAGGHYEGTANLGMGGEYQAKATVTAGGDTGTAVYRFSASQ